MPDLLALGLCCLNKALGEVLGRVCMAASSQPITHEISMKFEYGVYEWSDIL